MSVRGQGVQWGQIKEVKEGSGGVFVFREVLDWWTGRGQRSQRKGNKPGRDNDEGE